MEPGPTRILLVEDSPSDARLFRTMLAPAGFMFELMQVDRLSAALDYLEHDGVDVVLLDLSLPDSSGLDTVTRLRERAPHVPIVILTGADDDELAIKTVQAGAQDYLVKGRPSADSLVRCIRYAIERTRVEKELRQSEEANRAKSEFLATMS
ncbi:MAG: response regulator, partial [Planctomycetota bacterium]